MGLSKIDICNHALLKVGADTIASLDINENDTESVIQSFALCNIFFDQALEEVLRTYRWNSVMERSQLVRLTETPAFKWKHKYQLPNDCIRVINVYETTDAFSDGTSWVVEGKNILTDYNNVFLSYVKKPNDVSTLNPFLTQCVIQNLAIKLSIPLQLESSVKNDLIEEYNLVILPQARSVDNLENKYWEMEESDFLNSRYYTSPII
tara:strand:- start:2546 stop:3166 length:621 start_codon:yes stop_codon:yes gene_type:complete